MPHATRSSHKLGLVVLGVLALALAASVAGAAVVLNEPFSYPDGPLVGNGTWTAHSGAGNKVIMVSAGKITLEQSGGSGEDVNATYAAQAATARTFSSFDLMVPSGATLGGSDYFAHFRTSSNFNYRTRVYVQSPTGAGNYSIGLSTTSGGATATWPTDLTFDVTYKVVTAYDASTGTSDLWIDPVSEASSSISSADAAAAGEPVDSYAFRQGSSVTAFQVIDNLLIGQSFDDVAGAATPATPTTWGRMKALYR